MRISLPHCARLIPGIVATAFLLGSGFPMTAFAASMLPQAGKDAATETPLPSDPPPPLPKPKPAPPTE